MGDSVAQVRFGTGVPRATMAAMSAARMTPTVAPWATTGRRGARPAGQSQGGLVRAQGGLASRRRGGQREGYVLGPHRTLHAGRYRRQLLGGHDAFPACRRPTIPTGTPSSG